MEYITVKEAAEKWGITVRQVQNQCIRGKIPGAIRFSRAWAIPNNIKKPKDGRYKTNNDRQNNVIQSFQSMRGNEEIVAKIVEFFPYPIHVYKPDGVIILMNEACIKVFHIANKDKIIGKFNVLKDPIIDQWGEGVRECIFRAFRGETVQLNNKKMPIQGIIERFGEGEICSDSIFQNITCFPIYNDHHQLAYVVNVFITSKLYHGREEIIKGKEYIERHWQDVFDIDAAAKASGLSKSYFLRLFKKLTGFTPHDYYMEIKIDMMKEKLLNLNLSISQVFAECGVDYNSHYIKIFKKRVGTTPSEYRKKNK